MANVWQRSSSIPFPQVWKTIKGLVKINGKIPEFWIQDIPENMFENVTQLMTTKFFANEPLRKCAGFLQDEVSVAEGNEMWRKALKQRLGVVALTKDDNGNPEIAGVLIHCRNSQNDPPPEYKGRVINNISLLRNYVYQKANFYQEFGITEMISDIGGYTYPKYSHQRVTTEMLNCREQLAKAVGIKMAFSLFTSEKSQKVAENGGFKVHTTMTYEELAKIDERFYILGIEKYAKCIKLMYRSYE